MSDAIVSYLPIFYFSSTVSCSSLPVVWSDVLCRVQCHHLPHHHLRPNGNEPRPRCQVQCPSDCHGHRRHHQPGGHPHSRRDLRHGGCLAHRTGWDLTSHITASVLLMCITLGQLISFFWMSFFPYSLTHTAWIFDLSHSRNVGKTFLVS